MNLLETVNLSGDYCGRVPVAADANGLQYILVRPEGNEDKKALGLTPDHIARYGGLILEVTDESVEMDDQPAIEQLTKKLEGIGKILNTAEVKYDIFPATDIGADAPVFLVVYGDLREAVAKLTVQNAVNEADMKPLRDVLDKEFPAPATVSPLFNAVNRLNRSLREPYQLKY